MNAHSQQKLGFVKQKLVPGVSLGTLAVMLTLLFMLLTAGEAYALYDFNSATFNIKGDTGGDCELIGIWNTASKTCTLTSDINIPPVRPAPTDGISIFGATLDGNGHKLEGSSLGVMRNGVVAGSNSAVKNLTVSNFHDGIVVPGEYPMEGSYTNVFIVNNVLMDNSQNGIWVSYLTWGRISENYVSGSTIGINSDHFSGYHGSSEAYIDKNEATGNTVGISIDGGQLEILENNIHGNTDGLWLMQQTLAM